MKKKPGWGRILPPESMTARGGGDTFAGYDVQTIDRRCEQLAEILGGRAPVRVSRLPGAPPVKLRATPEERELVMAACEKIARRGPINQGLVKTATGMTYDRVKRALKDLQAEGRLERIADGVSPRGRTQLRWVLADRRNDARAA